MSPTYLLARNGKPLVRDSEFDAFWERTEGPKEAAREQIARIRRDPVPVRRLLGWMAGIERELDRIPADEIERILDDDGSIHGHPEYKSELARAYANESGDEFWLYDALFWLAGHRVEYEDGVTHVKIPPPSRADRRRAAKLNGSRRPDGRLKRPRQ